MTLPDWMSAEFSMFLRLLCGTLAGIAVGWERTLKHKDAGIRTFGLVGLGAAAASAIFASTGDADSASRVVQGILTGIGFLGAGMITIARKVAKPDPDSPDKMATGLLDAHKHTPHGLTTAAAIWVTAALGCAAGLGNYNLVLMGAGLALLLLAVDHSIERWAGRR